MVRASLCALQLCAVAMATAIPWPSDMFYPLDAVVGNVQRVSDGVIAERLSEKHALVVGVCPTIHRFDHRLPTDMS